jgi:hypothetical protein
MLASPRTDKKRLRIILRCSHEPGNLFRPVLPIRIERNDSDRSMSQRPLESSPKTLCLSGIVFVS